MLKFVQVLHTSHSFKVSPKLPLSLTQKDSTLLLQKGTEWDEVGNHSPGNLAAEQNKEEKYLYSEM